MLSSFALIKSRRLGLLHRTKIDMGIVLSRFLLQIAEQAFSSLWGLEADFVILFFSVGLTSGFVLSGIPQTKLGRVLSEIPI